MQTKKLKTKQCLSPDITNSARRLSPKQFKLPIQHSIKIIDEVRKIEKYNKSIRPDEDRKQYQNLLQWINKKLPATKQLVQNRSIKHQNIQTQNSPNYSDIFDEKLQQQTLQQEIQMQQRKIIQCLMQQMIDMFKKECKQKSQLMEICFQYFNQLINLYTKHYQKQVNQTIKLYNINLNHLKQEYGDRLNECNKKIAHLQVQKQTKWKNIYMLAKDNRILRRQKGKLLRNVQQQQEKLRNLQSQLCQLAKQNQLNKLVIRFQNDSQNLKVFMRNRLALMKFQKIIQKYPKKAMKVLNNDLLKLQIQELNSLDSKIDYIKRVIVQSGDVYDQYEDMNQLIAKPNKLVFNMFTQTDPQDIQPAKQYKQMSINTQFLQISKHFQHWQQVHQYKIPGFPELRQKYVCFKNPNRRLTDKLVKKKPETNDKKDFFLMQICQKQVYQIINITNKKIFQQFQLKNILGVAFNPLLKKKNKLYFTNSLNTTLDSFNLSGQQNMDSIYSQTLPANINKYSFLNGNKTVRKSDIQSSKTKYSLNKLVNKKNLLNVRNSQNLNLQKTMELTKDYQNGIIDERSQFQQSNDSGSQCQPEPQGGRQQDLQSQFTYVKKLIKNKKMARRTITQTSFKGLQRNSSIPKLSNFAASIQKQNQNSFTGRKSNQKQQTSLFEQKNANKTKRGSTQQKGRRVSQLNSNEFRKITKTSRIKTSQNLRNSKSSSRNKTKMDFIYEEQQQNEDGTNSNLKNVKQNSRLSYAPPINTIRNSKMYDTSNNFDSFKLNQLNQIQGILAQKNKKCNLTVNSTLISARKSAYKFNPKNSSFNMNQLHNRQRIVNIDTCSMNSHHLSQYQSTFNQKKYIIQMKPHLSFEIFETQNRDPIFIKPYEVKKLVDKIVKSAYTRRKQLLSNPATFCLKIFIQSFLKQIYGNNWKGDKNILRYIFSIQDRQGSSNSRVFSLMLNTNVHLQYLEDLFRLYLTMLQKNEYSGNQNPLITNKENGAGILKYLLSIYFQEGTAIDIQQNLPFMNQYQIDLNQVFIVVQNQLRKYTIQTQIYDFLLKLMPVNQSNLQFSQLKQILYLFKTQQKYHSHIARLKYFFKTYGKNIIQQYSKSDSNNPTRNSKTDKTAPTNSNNVKKNKQKEESKPEIQILPIHRVCLYFKRYQWNDIIEINTFIEEKYHKMIGVFIQEEAIKFIRKYCSILSARSKRKKTVYQADGISYTAPQLHQQKEGMAASHPLFWLLQRGKQIIRNYYRYKTPVHRHFLMFLQVSILTYELEIEVNDVLSESLNSLNIEYKKIKTKQQVDSFMKQ